MALAETLRLGKESHWFHKRPKHANAMPQSSDPSPIPAFSPAFTAQRERQQQLDERLAGVTEGTKVKSVPPGGDHVVDLVDTTNGLFVVKTLIPTSRHHLVFGLGIPANGVPPDNDIAARQKIVEAKRHVEVDPHQVADNIRLVQILADTYLNPVDQHAILPTAIVVTGDKVQNIQRFREEIPTENGYEKEVRVRAKLSLFERLNERWAAMLKTPDFALMPKGVRDYWRAFPPDSGEGSNAAFLGLDHVVAFDF